MIKKIKYKGQIFVLASTLSDLNDILSYFTPKYQAELKLMFPVVEQSLKEEVVDSKFVNHFESLVHKASDYTRPLLNKAIKKVGKVYDRSREGENKYLQGFDYKEEFHDAQYLFNGGTAYEVNHPEKFVEKYGNLVAPLTQKYPEFGKALASLIDLTKKLIPVHEIIKKLESMKTNKAIEKYKPPQAKIQSMKSLYDILDKFMADTKDEMISYWESALLKGADRLVSIYADKQVPYKEYRNLSSSCMKLIDVNKSKMGFIENFRLKENAVQLALEEATDIADSIKKGFLAKGVNKLATIIENRGDYDSAEKVGLSFYSGAIEGRILIKFKNGDSFSVNTQVVSAINQQGTAYTQYPLTFHNVKLGDKNFKFATEKWMNENFKT